ncbi:MAG TPA: SDR family oxidoreductase [Kiloniellales bacterium]|nr:SDR family oxidoreductase [Kiloniellales bacterium]
MGGRLAGKRAFVTAAGQGIGRATALAFAAEGAEVIATTLVPADLVELAKLPNVTTAPLDVRVGAAVGAAAAAAGPVDILFNCAGFVHHGTVLDCSEEEWDRSFDLNVKSMYRTLRAFLPGMLERRRGSIINVASAVSSIKGAPNRFVYGATKAAVIGLTKAVAADFIRQGIRCNCLCPGTIETPSLHQRIAAFADPVKARADFIARQPMGRLGTAEEVAAAAVYLASDEAAFTTGTAVVIDGGFTL